LSGIICAFFSFSSNQEGSILNARFPVAGEIDAQAMKAAEYFVSTIGDFRLRLKAYVQPKACATLTTRHPSFFDVFGNWAQALALS
jgi:hypothetical protein